MDEEIKRATNTDIWVKLATIEGKIDMLVERATTSAHRIDDHEDRLRPLEAFQNKIYWIIGIPTGITGLLVTLLLTGVLK